MWAFLVRRVFLAIPVLLIVSFLSFIGMELVPGDTLTTFFGQGAEVDLTQEQLDALRHEYGLDRPLLVRYVSWMGDVVRGDLGQSLRSGRPVDVVLKEKLSVSIWLSSVTLVMNIGIGLLLGLIAGVNARTKIDLVATGIAVYGIATPSFWMAIIILIIVFSIELGWFPASGWVPPLQDPLDAAKHMVLPVLALGLFGSATVMRQTRSAVVEALSQDYVRTAHAKGLAKRVIVMRHVLKNALIPTITVMALLLSGLVAGSVFIETIFAIPGVGRLAVDATRTRDYPVLQAIVLLSATMIVFANFLADVAYAALDPRIRYR
jgi:peptide/nickel transport system permease protein